MADFKLETLGLHAGQEPDSEHGSRAQPIHFTTSYVFPNTDTAASLFNMELGGHVYSRISNPTMEGGVGGIAVASGQAALHLAITTLMGQGGHIVASQSLYGGSHNLLQFTLPRFGIDTTFVDFRDLNRIEAAIKPETRLIFSETLGNPGLDILNIPAVSKLAHDRELPLMVDSTFTTPYLLKPLKHGADIIVHSATKFLGGHGVAVGGLVIDGGGFDWTQRDKFPTLSEPYQGFHGMTFTDESPVAAFLLRARREGLRDFGACMSPMNAFQIMQGIETLGPRMQRHVENTRAIVNFLNDHASVKKVIYPELNDHPDNKLATELLPNGVGAVFTFELKDGRQAGKKFIEKLKIFSHLANVGDAKSLVIHPASTTHFRMSDDDLLSAGITPGTVRLSIGLENIDDLKQDLKQALKFL
jgi:O-acetylhomoserine (thiol)-lyase